MTATRSSHSAQTIRHRLEPDARREQILQCAVELFGERPYAAVSTSELAQAAGVTRGLLHHYFGTKRDLYVEVVRTILFVPRLELPDDIADDLDARMTACVDRLLDNVEQHGKTYVAVFGAEGIGADPEVESLLADADDKLVRRLLLLIGLSPEAVTGSRVQAIGRAYGALVKGAVREWVRAGTLTRDDVQELLVRTLRTIVLDVLPAGPPGIPDPTARTSERHTKERS